MAKGWLHMPLPRAFACMPEASGHVNPALESSAAVDRVRDVIREEVLALAAYHVAESRGMVKLDAMENPYGLPDALREELVRQVAHASMNRYPDPGAARLKARLRQTLGLADGVELLLGNGSDEIIQMLTIAVARPGAVVMSPEPSFVMYQMLARALGLRHVAVPLNTDFSLDGAALLDAIEQHRPALLWLAYPNNPTGNLFDRNWMIRAIAACPGLVVVDEAYHAFAGDSFLGEVGRQPNLLVMRTLSKVGLAGLRLGMLLGTRVWLDELDKVRLPYNINVLTQLAAEAILAHHDVLDAQARLIREARAGLMQALGAIGGVEVFPSAANFLLVRVARARHVFEALRRRGVLIKNLAGAHPLLEGCLRITVSTPEENVVFLDAFRAALSE